jgi:hypothetical protein
MRREKKDVSMRLWCRVKEENGLSTSVFVHGLSHELAQDSGDTAPTFVHLSLPYSGDTTSEMLPVVAQGSGDTASSRFLRRLYEKWH